MDSMKRSFFFLEDFFLDLGRGGETVNFSGLRYRVLIFFFSVFCSLLFMCCAREGAHSSFKFSFLLFQVQDDQ